MLLDASLLSRLFDYHELAPIELLDKAVEFMKENKEKGAKKEWIKRWQIYAEILKWIVNEPSEYEEVYKNIESLRKKIKNNIPDVLGLTDTINIGDKVIAVVFNGLERFPVYGIISKIEEGEYMYLTRPGKPFTVNNDKKLEYEITTSNRKYVETLENIRRFSHQLWNEIDKWKKLYPGTDFNWEKIREDKE